LARAIGAKGTTKPIIARLNEAFAQGPRRSATQKRLGDLAQDIPPISGRQKRSDNFKHAYIDKGWPIIKPADIKAQ
jgi:hypothetical protein